VDSNVKKQTVSFRNSGVSPNDIIQNRFAAYLQRAVRRERKKYLYQKNKYLQANLPFFEHQEAEENMSQEVNNELLQSAIFSMSERDKNILFAHVLMDQTHTEIAGQLSMTVSAVQKAYQRIILRLRQEMDY